MQNTVIQRNALNLSSNAYMNSTTKYVKGMVANPQVVENNKNTAIIASIKSAHQFQKGESSPILSSLIVHSSSVRLKQHIQQQKSADRHQDQGKQNTNIELVAMNLSANIFMNSTTKFVKGFADLAPLNNTPSKQKKHHQIKKITRRQKNQTSSVSASPTKPNTQKIGLEMTAANYMTSTTKYLKNGALVQNYKVSIQKIVKTQKSNSSKKLHQTLNRNRFKNDHQVEKSGSKSDSESRLSRKKKDRTQQLKFIEPKHSNQSQSTIKDHPHPRQNSSIIQVNNKKKEVRAESQKQPNSKLPNKINNQTNLLNTNKIPASLPTLPAEKKQITRNQIKEIKSSDTKKIQKKQQSQRPFTRQPQKLRPHLLTTQKLQQLQNTESMTSILDFPAQDKNKPIQKMARVKSQNVVGNVQLLLQTPVKNTVQSKEIQRQEEKQAIKNKPLPISVIKQERSSMIQNTKISVYNNNNKSPQFTIQQQAHNNPVIQIKPTVNQPHNKKQSVKNSEIKQKQSSQLAKARSTPSIKPQDKLQQTIMIASKRPIIRNTIQNQVSKTRLKDQVVHPTKIDKDKPAKVQIVQKEKQVATSIPQQLHTIGHLLNQPIIKASQNKNVKLITEQIKPLNQVMLKQSPEIKKYPALTAKGQESLQQEKIPQKQEWKQLINSKSTPQIKKITTKQAINSEQNIQTPQTSNHQKLSSSKVVAFVLQRLYIQNIKKGFNNVKSNVKYSLKHSKQAAILSYEISHLYQHLYKIQLRNAFDILKKQFLYKNTNEKPINNTNSKQIASSLVFRSMVSKLREYFHSIKWGSRLFEQHLPQSKQQLKTRSQQSTQLNSYVVPQVIHIIDNYQLDLKRKSFYKLQEFASTRKNQAIQRPTQTPNIRTKFEKPTRNYQLQKQNLTNQKTQLQSSINTIEARTSDKKRSSDVEKAKLSKKQNELIQKTKASDNKALVLRKKNKQLMLTIESLGSSSDLDITLPQSQPLVSLLTEIYSWVFGNINDKFNVQDIRQKYGLHKQEQSQLLKEWQILNNNCKLRAAIGKWQRENQSSYPKSMKQKQTAQNVLKGYVRQRYLWQWVRINAQRL